MVEIPTRVKVELSLEEAAFLQYLIQDFRNEPDSHPAWDYKLSTDQALAIYNKLFR